MTKRRCRAQSVLEYAAFISIIILAFIAMRVYIQRGLQGKIKDMAQEISTEQYTPENVDSSYEVTQQQRVHTQRQGHRTTQDVYSVMTRDGDETSHLEFDDIFGD